MQLPKAINIKMNVFGLIYVGIIDKYTKFNEYEHFNNRRNRIYRC